MQGYFEYKLFGDKKDLENALDKIKKLSTIDEDYRWLTWFPPLIVKSSNCNEHELKMGMPESGNINSVSFLYDEMMSKLCKDFSEFEAWGTGYNLDFRPYPEWSSTKGSSAIDETFAPIHHSEEIDISDIIDENGDIIANTISIECECCNEEIIVPIDTDNLLDEDGEPLGGEVNCTCDCCGLLYSVEACFYS